MLIYFKVKGRPICTHKLAIRLLVSRTGAGTSKLFGLAAARISHKQRTVKGNKHVSDFLFAGLVDKLLIVGNDGLGKRLSDGYKNNEQRVCAGQ